MACLASTLCHLSPATKLVWLLHVLYKRNAVFNILVLGDINADLAGMLAYYADEGDDSQLDALTWCSGGSAANTATALALLGDSVGLIGRVGSDPAAEIALRAARSAGVALDLVQYDPLTATGLCLAAVSPSGQRTFFSF